MRRVVGAWVMLLLAAVPNLSPAVAPETSTTEPASAVQNAKNEPADQPSSGSRLTNPTSMEKVVTPTTPPGSEKVQAPPASSNGESKELRQQLSDLQNAIRSYRDELKAISAENGALKAQLASLSSEHQDFKHNLPTIQADNANLKAQLSALGTDYAKLQVQLVTTTTANTQLAEAINNLEKTKAEKLQVSALNNQSTLNNQRLAAIALQANYLNGAVQGISGNLRAHSEQLAKLQSGNITGLSSVMSYDAKRRMVTFKTVNIEIVNGLGATATENGLGNLIIGYNENRLLNYPAVCQGKNAAGQQSCAKALNNSLHTGSHNLVMGTGNDFTRYASIIGGVLQP